MAKSCNQKAKILYLERMLSGTTGENPISMQEILAKLEERGIRAERKSIYDDMETLRDFGMEIHYRRGREGGYFTENKIQVVDAGISAAAVAAITADNGTVSAVSVSAPVPDRNGENTKELKLICQNSARKKILRAFGQDVSCKAKGEDTFTVTVEVAVDKAFFGWMASMGRNVHILKPKKVAVAYRDYLKNIAKDYKGIDK